MVYQCGYDVRFSHAVKIAWPKRKGLSGLLHNTGKFPPEPAGLPCFERLARSQLGYHVYQLLVKRKPPQREIAALLGIKQPEVSHLMNGHFNRFTTDKLLPFLERLDRKVTIQIRPHHSGEPYQEVGFGL
jgi:predicted XRE-type DNA-binding protein